MTTVRPSHKPIMKKRAAFLNAAKGVFIPRGDFVMQRNTQIEGADAALREANVGFTVTKKVGNAVVRNRARRRLREAVRHSRAGLFEPGFDYVLVGRQSCLEADFSALCKDVERTLNGFKNGEGRRSRPRPAQKSKNKK